MQLDSAEVLQLFRTDEMTGLFHRAYFLERVREDMLRSERYGWPLAILGLYLENLDKIESLHGKFAADRVLTETASMVRKFARNTDIACRAGACEFALLLPGTTAEGAAKMAERLAQRMATHLFSAPDGQAVDVASSVGAAEFSADVKSADQFLERARLARARRDVGAN